MTFSLKVCIRLIEGVLMLQRESRCFNISTIDSWLPSIMLMGDGFV